ncbi:hypothetical protein INS49_014098 [Diaporthe citri]|uniref:uncharacterized protein n=1 Tax=Diaporthe citri TaxID=83186 RepID=UPI001C80ED8C|nr:uncharacterized protein INS49_014098 [Diaporthe citri]KAG6358214.1 hypothetical protein INS49_014098 [Diaporthe citri]
MKHTDSTRTKSSKISQITKPLKTASSHLDQKLQKLRSRVSKPKTVGEASEKPSSICTPSPEIVQEPTVEGKPTVDADTTNKDDVKKARRDARRAKWAAKRESLKRLAKKAGKAVVLVGAVILGFIFGPIIIVVDLVLSLVALVIQLVLQLAGLICAPFLVCLVYGDRGKHSLDLGWSMAFMEFCEA